MNFEGTLEKIKQENVNEDKLKDILFIINNNKSIDVTLKKCIGDLQSLPDLRETIKIKNLCYDGLNLIGYDGSNRPYLTKMGEKVLGNIGG